MPRCVKCKYHDEHEPGKCTERVVDAAGDVDDCPCMAGTVELTKNRPGFPAHNVRNAGRRADRSYKQYEQLLEENKQDARLIARAFRLGIRFGVSTLIEGESDARVLAPPPQTEPDATGDSRSEYERTHGFPG